jgi:sec-independent protein translocase protein TatB
LLGGIEFLQRIKATRILCGNHEARLWRDRQSNNQLRAMAAEFRASFDDMARQSELDELRQEVEAMRRSQGDLLTSETADVNQVFREIGDSLQGSDIQFHPPMGGAPVEIEAPVPQPSIVPESLPEVPAAPKPRRRRKPAGAPE